VLIVLPPSESKRPPPGHGRPVDLDALSFPALAAVRTQVLDAMIATSAGPDAFKRLQVGPSIAAQVAQNTLVRELPAVPVLDVYTGPLHAGLAAGSLSGAGVERADRTLVIASPLWGLLRPADRIPPYRLHICSRLVGMDWLKPTWRPVLGPVLAEAAGPEGIVVDLRSPNYQAMGMPTGIGDRTVNLHVDMKAGGGGSIGVVLAKQMRGEAARLLLESGEEPEDPGELARVLAERWPVSLREPERPGKPWTMTLVADQ
jgi:cytoplasmic iron level regulating protein YaaA (DUF328/UPF0246 family)